MAKKQTYAEAITGNRLTDGVVVYLNPVGGWTEKVEEAAVANDPGERAALETKAAAGLAAQLITHWEIAEVEQRDGKLSAVKNKETSARGFLPRASPHARRRWA